MKLIELIDKPVQWLILVGVICIYLIKRAKHLSWFDRLTSAVISAGLAYAGSAELAPVFLGNELVAAIVIMLVGPLLMGGLMTAAEDQDFLKGTMQSWARKQLGVEDSRNDPEN